MQKGTFSLTAISVILILLFVGGAAYVGYLFGQGQATTPAGEAPVASNNDFSRFIESKLMRYATVSLAGRLTALSGRDVTLEKDGTSLKLTVPDSAQINKLPEPTGGDKPPVPQTIKLSDLKIGDSVEVLATLVSDGSWQVTNVTLFPTSETLFPTVSSAPRPSPSPAK